MNSKDKQELSDLIDKRLDKALEDIKNTVEATVKKSVTKSVYRSLAFTFSFVTILILGSYTYTSRLENSVKEHHREAVETRKDVDDINDAMRTVSGVLYEEQPESLILRSMYENYNRSRGAMK